MKPEFESDDAHPNPDTWDSARTEPDANDNPDIQVTEAELSALKDEVDVLHEGDTKQAADDFLTQKVMLSIQSIAKLATSASAERVRLDASKYIVERVLGPLSKVDINKDPDKDPMLVLLRKLTGETE